MKYLGIDIAETKPQYLAVLSDDQSGPRVELVVCADGQQRFTADEAGIAALASFVDREYPDAPISIDAPDRPLAACNIDANGKRTCGRRCEKQLNSMGIKIFYTPCQDLFFKPGFSCPKAKDRKSPGWMRVGFRVWQALAHSQPIEIFPHASFRPMLWQINTKYQLLPKTRDTGKWTAKEWPDVEAAAKEQRRSLLEAYGVDLCDWSHSANFDEIDAIAAAFTTYLHYVGATLTVGKEREGQIVIPTVIPPDDYWYEPPTLCPAPPSRGHRQQRIVAREIHVRYQDGREESRLPTEAERQAIDTTKIHLHSPDRADIVYCEVCGALRVVNPQDFFQVTKCSLHRRR